jgi:16S rRNA (uracil1498-N3)-methyltransferase
MRRLFLPPEALTGETAVVEGAGFRHLVRVLRAGPGDVVVLFDGRGQEVDGRIVRVGPRHVLLALGARRTPAVAPPCRLVLLQGLARGERMDLVVQKGAELGMTALVPVLASRSVPRPAGGPDGRQRRWDTIAREAARQCGRADVPRIEAPVPLARAVAEADPRSLRVVLDESGACEPLRRVLTGGGAAPEAITLLVGPEGGLDEGEVALAVAAGFRRAGLGPRILRTETAAIVALALAQAATGGLD